MRQVTITSDVHSADPRIRKGESPVLSDSEARALVEAGIGVYADEERSESDAEAGETEPVKPARRPRKEG